MHHQVGTPTTLPLWEEKRICHRINVLIQFTGLVGGAFAKSLAFGLNIPCYGIHHLEAPLMAALLVNDSISFPFLALLISGGHSQIIQAKSFGHYEIIGETLDDACGEAFDKI